MAFEVDDPGAGGEYLDPKGILGHLLAVWAIRYIEHSPTRHSVPGRNSDVIVVDGVDLDQVDSDGYEGVIGRNSWWRQSRLIMVLKKRVGLPNPILIRLSKGTQSNSPYELHTQSADKEAMSRFRAWCERNPDFVPSSPGEVEANPVQPQTVAPLTQKAWGGGPGPQTRIEETPLEAQARLAQQSAPTSDVLARLRGLGKVNHQDQPQNEEIPF
jgi:hypothetical protein